MLPETYLTGDLQIEASLQNPKIGGYAYSLTFYATERLWFASQSKYSQIKDASCHQEARWRLLHFREESG